LLNSRIRSFFYFEMMSALFRSEFYTRMKRYWGENIYLPHAQTAIYDSKVKLFTRYFYPPEIVYSTGRNYWTPQKLAVVKTTSTMVDRLVEYFSDHTYITGDYTKLCLNIICNRSFFYFEMMSALFRSEFYTRMKRYCVYISTPVISDHQGFQSGPVPGTFTRLRSCIVPAEIT
jgi:hypothetical protein